MHESGSMARGWVVGGVGWHVRGTLPGMIWVVMCKVGKAVAGLVRVGELGDGMQQRQIMCGCRMQMTGPH